MAKVISDKAKITILESALTNLIEKFATRDDDNEIVFIEEQQKEIQQAMKAVDGCRKYHIWTIDELEILREIYPGGGRNAVRRLLPHLSNTQIHGKVYALGLKRK